MELVLVVKCESDGSCVGYEKVTGAGGDFKVTANSEIGNLWSWWLLQSVLLIQVLVVIIFQYQGYGAGGDYDHFYYPGAGGDYYKYRDLPTYSDFTSSIY